MQSRENMNQRVRNLSFNTKPLGTSESMQSVYSRAVVVAMNLLRDTDAGEAGATVRATLMISDPEHWYLQ